MSEIFEPIILKIGDVNYEVVSEPSNYAKESLINKFKRIIKDDIENVLI